MEALQAGITKSSTTTDINRNYSITVATGTYIEPKDIAELASKIYPNPFNPKLGGNIAIDKLPTSGQTIKIYTVTEELVNKRNN